MSEKKEVPLNKPENKPPSGDEDLYLNSKKDFTPNKYEG